MTMLYLSVFTAGLDAPIQFAVVLLELGCIAQNRVPEGLNPQS